MTDYLMMGDYTRWEVIWISTKTGRKRVIVQEFDTDLKGALDLYVRAKAAGKPFATLRCCNVGFPPPEKYRPHYVTVKTGEYKIVRRGGKRYRKPKYKTVWYTPLHKVNLKGIWWCPYCREFRKFMKQSGARSEGVFIASEGMYCPICQISHRNSHVRKWNPKAQEIEFKIGRRSSRGSGKRKRNSRKAR